MTFSTGEHLVVEIPATSARLLLSPAPDGWGDIMGLEADFEQRLAALGTDVFDGHGLDLQTGGLRLFLGGVSERDAKAVIAEMLRSRPAGRNADFDVRLSGGASETTTGDAGTGRLQVQDGDVFRIQLDEGDAVFGRVVDVNFRLGKVPGLVLAYVYDLVSTQTTPGMSHLSPQCLLIPVQITNLMGWKRGAFKTVCRVPLTAVDLLPVHNFAYWDKNRPIVVDQTGAEVKSDCEPCGVFLLAGYDMIIDRVRAALGRVPLEGAADS